MKLSAMKINGRVYDDGSWVGDLPGLPGVRVKVRPIGNDDATALRNKMLRDLPATERQLGATPQTTRLIANELLIRTVLVGWDGIEGDDGKPLPYSEAKARELIESPDFDIFREGVLYASSLVRDLARTEIEDAAKN